MGYSCTVQAADALGRIEYAAQQTHGLRASNLVVNKDGRVVGFYERGRERNDGAITGTIWKWVDYDPERLDNLAHRAGHFRINPDGEVQHFPYMSRKILAAAHDYGAPIERRCL